MSRPGISEKLGQTRPGSAGSNGTAGQVTEGAANTIATKIAPKIERKIGRRGWDRDSINETIAQPQRTVTTRDTRHNPKTGARNDGPATAMPLS
ncbi:colicin E5-related ribonuclease [Agrobacterium tumefaciens]|uniref:colicin E5-related ribonuclease n=1 Tax=Agrobacterium tumefaciens TaxID=358 RepID=UPI000DCFEFAC|nr:hypothetical protein [Agrobacterium tumefaciens]NSZ71244.1 hypothetical protein [Agrobacterium tumefaciens]NSZ76564.1 hypothetical protein [Agrobacterium tumefaciens]